MTVAAAGATTATMTTTLSPKTTVDNNCKQFNFVLPSRQIANRRDRFINSDIPRTNLLTFDIAYMSWLITN